MKKFLTIALVLVLTLSLMAGCGRKEPAATTTPSTSTAPTTRPTTMPTTRPTTAPTTAPTTPSTDMTGPDMTGPDMTGPGMDGLIPGAEDTVDPSSGANQENRQRSRTNSGF